MTKPPDMDVGYDLLPNILDAPITPPTPADARRVALHAVTAGRDVAERRELLEALGLWEILQ